MNTGISIICETGNVDDMQVINNETGEEMKNIESIELSSLSKGSGSVMARITFSKVYLKLGAKVATVQSASSGSIK